MWLNIAAIELSVFSRQCLDRRISDEATLKRAIKQLAAACNAINAKIEWRFTTEAARQKLHRLSPSTSNLRTTSLHSCQLATAVLLPSMIASLADMCRLAQLGS